MSTGLIVVGLLLLGAGGLMAYLTSAALVEPPPPVGVVEPPPPSLEENPLPVVVDSASAERAVEPLSPPSLDQNPLPVLTTEEELVREAVLDVAPAPTSLSVPVASSSAPELEAAGTEGEALYESVRQAEQDVPSGSPSPASNSVPAAVSPPTRIVAPTIDLDADVVPVGWKQVLDGGKLVSVWEVAEYAAGWHENTALPGAGGNVVLSGHHNVKGEVFRYIIDLDPGDTVTLYADERPYTYTVESRFVVRDKGMSEEKRRENARWIGAFPDERLTLVTCWPYTNNTHRVIVIAKPAE
jgi:sortase A